MSVCLLDICVCSCNAVACFTTANQIFVTFCSLTSKCFSLFFSRCDTYWHMHLFLFVSQRLPLSLCCNASHCSALAALYLRAALGMIPTVPQTFHAWRVCLSTLHIVRMHQRLHSKVLGCTCTSRHPLPLVSFYRQRTIVFATVLKYTFTH